MKRKKGEKEAEAQGIQWMKMKEETETETQKHPPKGEDDVDETQDTEWTARIRKPRSEGKPRRGDRNAVR